MALMPHEEEPPTCDVCGEPATNRAIDILRHEASGSSTEIGAPKYGCEKHPAELVIHRTEISPGHKGHF
jgi:hypothetical protein